MASTIAVRQADLKDAAQAAAVVDLLDMYSQNEFGSGKTLPEFVRANLIPGLKAQPGSLVFLAFDGELPVGLAICFWGFSSFNAKPLINIHDLAVAPTHRGRGIGQSLLEAIEAAARSRGACRITLEVRDDNVVAQRLYERMGIVPSQPQNWFWMKKLD
jgi:ribosomal protein S18 acetylase RimI-like enzyme